MIEHGQEKGGVVESRFTWLYHFVHQGLRKCLWLPPRGETPTETALRSVISGKDSQIESLQARIEALEDEKAELRVIHESEQKTAAMKLAAALMEKAVLEHETEFLTETNERLLLRVKAENVALSARIPEKERG